LAQTGTAVLDFGSFPGSSQTQVPVTGQAAIIASSQVEAWVSLETATADHSQDEHRVENFRIMAGTVVPGTGFTIYGESDPPVDSTIGDGNRIYGKWTINWVWA
jgi:hypothetical protein